MKQIIEMPEVMMCNARECVYNADSRCHARAITVGDLHGHLCDTAWKAKQHTQRRDGAGVGACRATSCAYNEDFECQADGISVAASASQIQCATFTAR